ncbi:MAG TPA: pyridoxal phosphate-dependent aminotransferase [Candidatus Bathyarchaeia archaeon]|nr:pyridoxal phosphate-dependent aminotransferase [Candidatus Bathyarchaeia archaeon]
MRHQSLYLQWYVQVPKVKYDLRSSGIATFKYNLALGEVDLSTNYARGNPETVALLAKRYHVAAENLFISSEGASGQNARVIRVLREKNPSKKEAVVEFPTYEPLLRLAQEHFPIVRRLEREESEDYRLNVGRLRKIVSSRTGLLVLTNPHLPSGAVSNASELKEIMGVAREHGFYVVCDEIYAEFSREAIPSIFSVDKKLGIVTTGFSKAYGLGGLKMGVAIADGQLIDEFYADTLSTVGVFSNIVDITMTKLLTEGYEAMEQNKQKYLRLKQDAQEILDEKRFEYFPNDFCITFWVKLPVKDTHRWINEHTIPRHSSAAVPGAFFLFRNDNKLAKSNMIRLGLGYVNPDKPNLDEAFNVLQKAIKD